MPIFLYIRAATRLADVLPFNGHSDRVLDSSVLKKYIASVGLCKCLKSECDGRDMRCGGRREGETEIGRIG